MRIQSDQTVRCVALTNLQAMCKRVSGFRHRYWIKRVTANRCYVAYSNPDEYGAESPMVAVFPTFPLGFPGNCYVALRALHFLNVQQDNWNGDGWQAFHALIDCPELFRSGPDSDDWRTREEIERARKDAS